MIAQWIQGQRRISWRYETRKPRDWDSTEIIGEGSRNGVLRRTLNDFDEVRVYLWQHGPIGRKGERAFQSETLFRICPVGGSADIVLWQ